MRPLVIAAVLLFAAVPMRAQTRGAVDWIFLVDTSLSMRGVGGSRNIFGDVQESIKTFVRQASDGDSVSVYTFDRDVRPHAQVDLRGSRDELLSIVDGLQANGNRTHLGAAIARGLDRSEALMKDRQDPTRTRAIVLFTDGKEDVRGIANPISIPSNVERAQVSKPWIFFVSMGEHEPQLDAFVNARGKVLHATDPEAIRDVARDIRTTVQAEPPPVPQRRVMEVPKAQPLPEPPSTLARVMKWAAAVAVLLLLAVIGLVLYSGRMPGELLEAIRGRNVLEGEIEIVAPRTPADAAFVGLPGLNTKEVALSSFVPLDALAGNDARLFVRRKDGVKRVWIASNGGSLRVNDIEVPATELYDADTIRVGDAKLRFNRVGHERPEENV
jgi:hypothetical protein